MDDSKIKRLDYENAVFEKSPTSPDEDSRFYRKFKSDLPLSNPTVVYRKIRKKLISC